MESAKLVELGYEAAKTAAQQLDGERDGEAQANKVMSVLFPSGVTPIDYAKFLLVRSVVINMCKIASQFPVR